MYVCLSVCEFCSYWYADASKNDWFTQQQQKYAGTTENCNFVIAVISLPIKLSEKCYAYYLGVHSDFKFSVQTKNFKYVKT